MRQELKICAGTAVDTDKSKLLLEISKEDAIQTISHAPKHIYCTHPSSMPEPIRCFWGNDKNDGKDDTTIRPFDPCSSVFSADNEQLSNVSKYVDLWLASNKSNRFHHSAMESTEDDMKNDKNWAQLSITKGEGYGIDFDDMFKLITYWKTSFNVDTHIATLSAFKHFQTQIQGLNLHYIQHKISAVSAGHSDDHKQNEAKTDSKNNNNTQCDAILLLHGWPGSIWEFHRLFEHFNANPLFHGIDIIVASLPGYGFSEYAMSKTRFTCIAVADIMIELMENRLKYSKYVVVAGDWGALIAQSMAMRLAAKYEQEPSAARNLLGMLTNNTFTSGNDMDLSEGLVELDLANPMVTAALTRQLDMAGYQLMNATRPNTIGITVESSPISIASYIYEKYLSWSDSVDDSKQIEYTKDGNRIISATLSWDDVIMTAYIYWLTGRVTSGMLYYAENMALFFRVMNKYYVPESIKVGIVSWKDGIERSSEANHKWKYRNIVMHKTMEKGGHFAALEQPAKYVENIAAFIETCNQE